MKMRNVKLQGVLVGLVLGLLLMHFYHARTSLPGSAGPKNTSGS